MSGGSFNYLCFKDAGDLIAGGHGEDLQRMADELAARGYHDIAVETNDLIIALRQVYARIDARLRRLSPVWKAIEWHESGDWGVDQIDAAVNKLRAEGAE